MTINYPTHFLAAPFPGDRSDHMEDAEPIRLSSHENDVDGFDFDELEHVLDNSNKSSAMDLDLGMFFQEEPPEGEGAILDPVKFASVDLDSKPCPETAVPSSPSGVRGGNHGIVHTISIGSIPQDEPRANPSFGHGNVVDAKNDVQANDIGFDPSPVPSSYPCQPPPQRRSSCGGLPRQITDPGAPVGPSSPPRPQRRVTLDSLASLDLDRALDAAPRRRVVPADPQRYRELVDKFAQSMRRTELSRRQLAMLGVPTTLTLKPRSSAPPPQPQPRQPIHFDARQRLQCRVAASSSGGCGGPSSSPVGGEARDNAAAFFAGRRRTLTDGLERSRRQLRMYVLRGGGRC